MSNTPQTIGDVAAEVLRHALQRAEMPRESRVKAGAAMLLAFVIRAHGDDAEDIVRECMHILDGQRETLPPTPFWPPASCPGYMSHGSSKVECERCGLLESDHR